MPRVQRTAKRRKGAGDVPLDSFSDIAFLLIIFFILTTTLQKTKGFQTELPAGQENSQASDEDNNPTITLSGDIIMYNDEQLELEKLRKRLGDLKLIEKEEDKRIIKLEAHSNVNYGQYYPVWAAIVKHHGVVAIVESEE